MVSLARMGRDLHRTRRREAGFAIRKGPLPSLFRQPRVLKYSFESPCPSTLVLPGCILAVTVPCFETLFVRSKNNSGALVQTQSLGDLRLAFAC